MQSLTAKLVASVTALFFLLFCFLPSFTVASTEERVGLQNMLPPSDNQKALANPRRMLIFLKRDEHHQRFVLQNSEFSGGERKLIQSVSRRSNPGHAPPSPTPNTNHMPNPVLCC